MESERHLRFQTGAVPRQGVWPTSQQDHTDPLSTLVFVLASGKRFCYFYMWRRIGWITAMNSKRNGMYFILCFKPTNRVTLWI